MYTYHDYIRTLAKRFDATLSYIDAIYNFDYGDEFEVALCEVLRNALPEKFGVCRGHIVAMDGQSAGDDIIIYDAHRFPTLRLNKKEDYSKKEWIPIEAMYAYIEAKHTLQIEGDDGDSASIRHAINQVAKVKRLCDTRAKVDYLQLKPYLNFGTLNLDVKPAPGFPDRLNPCFAGIMARRVCQKQGKPVLDRSQIHSLFAGIEFPLDACPDFIVAGSHNLVLPSIWDEASQLADFASPFFIPGLKRPTAALAPDIAFGVGLCDLLYALDWIDLGAMNWQQIILDAWSNRGET